MYSYLFELKYKEMHEHFYHLECVLLASAIQTSNMIAKIVDDLQHVSSMSNIPFSNVSSYKLDKLQWICDLSW